ncbi:MAG: hypothetical protein LBD27_07405 [Tannerella sp.]|jgi:hypothetical protein|nr:hypothetical protein [Tannerella sp.]
MNYLMNKSDTQATGYRLFLIFILACAVGCEEITPELTEGKVNMVESLINLGLNGYAVDSIYTEFDFYEGKSQRILHLRKGIIRHPENDAGVIQWNTSAPRLEYGGSFISYAYNGLRSEILLNAYGFAEYVTNRYGDGAFHSKLQYMYNEAGYLRLVRLERQGMDIAYISYLYEEERIIIREDPGSILYEIPLYARKEGNEIRKAENVGYVCNVLYYGNSPLTNNYVIIPDLYYDGIYGTPVKYLPEKVIEKGGSSPDKIRLLRVGNCYFYYE